MKFTIVFSILSVIWYSICAFISMEPNPANWGIDGRVAFIMLGSVLVTLFSLIIVENMKND